MPIVSRIVCRKFNALAAILLFLLWAGVVSGAERQVVRGHVPKAVAGALPAGRLAGTQRLDLAIGLPLRNLESLTNLLQQLYDPASPNYHQFLSAAEFRDRFGPTEADYQAVMEFAQAHGLEVTGTSSNRLLVDVNGPISEIEKTFQITLRTYPHPRENRTFFAPDAEPSLDLAVPVGNISGLDNFIIPHPMSLRPGNSSLATTPLAGSAPGGNFWGSDFRKAYVPGVTNTGTGQIVGLVEFDGYHTSDITTYEAQAGLVNPPPLQNVLLNHFNGSAGSGNDEVALDIELVVSMAPGLTKVIVYEASPTSTATSMMNRIASDNLAKQISASWTYGLNATIESDFLTFAAQGQSFYNASGDSDAYTGTVSPPCDDPNVTSVGGTTLTTDATGAWQSETVWNWGGGTGTGGGISTIYNIPSWQTNTSMASNGGSSSKRNLPDVAFTADHVWVVFSGGSSNWFGGTSCAAPLWAAFTALVNQHALDNGKTNIGFLNPKVYALGNGPNYPFLFHDITTGNNTSSNSPNNFFAASGYDLCTGWGTPSGIRLMNALAGIPDLPPTFAANPFGAAAAISGYAYAGTVAGSANDPYGSALTYAKVSGPAWLNVSGNGALGGTPANGDAGTNSFVISAMDAGALSNSATLFVVVRTNQPPVFLANPFSQPSINAGASYSGTIATNASDPEGGALTFAKISGPAWLNVFAAGNLSGFPGNADSGTNSFVVGVTDPGGSSANATLTIYVNGAPSFASSPFSEPGVNAGSMYSGSIASQASDPNGDALTFSKVSGPAWLAVSAAGGLSGTPANSDAGVDSFVVKVTDPGGLNGTATMTINVNGAPSFLSGSFAMSTINVGAAYSGTIAGKATDPNGDSLTYSKVSGPAWMNVAANGALSGTPGNGDIGTNSFTVKATDPGGLFGTATMTISVNGAPTFTLNPFAKPGASAGQAYSGSIAANATDPNGDVLRFALVSGPNWLNVASNGVLSGTPQNVNFGTNNFVVSVTDPGGLSANATLLIYVDAAPVFSSNPFSEPGINAGSAYSGSIASQASDPDGDTLTFSKVSGPAWLAVAANGSLSGTPANGDAGSNSFVVKAADPGGLNGTATMTIYVNGAPSFLSGAFGMPAINEGSAYAGTIAGRATDPNADTLVFSKVSGPGWLSVAADGTLSGTPGAGDIGTNSFTVKATDPGGLFGSATMTIFVNGAPSFTLDPFTKPDAIAGKPYFDGIATNAIDPNGAPLRFALVSGPDWLSVGTNGSLSGTPFGADFGTNQFVVSATDPGGLSASATLVIYVNSGPLFVISPITAPNASASQPYSASIAATATDPGGQQMIFAFATGPSWLQVATNGALSGIPSNADAGTNVFMVSATDSGGLTNSETLLIYVNGSPSFTNNPITQAAAIVGQPYSGSLAASASDPNADPLTFALVGGPSWLNVATNGTLSGTPTNTDLGTNSFVVKATDPGGLSASTTMLISVVPAPLMVVVTMQDGNLILNWSGGIGPFQVQTTADLSNPNWQNIGNPVGTNSVMLTPTGTIVYYRVTGQ